MKEKKRKSLVPILDVLFLGLGMTLVSVGIFLVYIPAGVIMTGLCFSALAFFIAKKQAQGG